MTQVVSSISGLEIYSPSAGFAPTNSGDVSAIASAYQVVSSTGTQLYAGTAYVTSVNGDALSAARAGNAANASLANSAYYDGTGRLISALPDAAEVSSIASSYAESAASSKLDTSAQVVTATAGDGTYVTSINGMGLSGQGGGGTQVVTATGSATALEGSWPYTTSYLVSSINGSALLPYGYSSLSANSANWYNARTAVTANSANWNSVYNTVSSNSASWVGGSVTSPSGTIFVDGDKIEGTNSAVLTASSEEGFTTSFAAIGAQIPSWTSQELYAGTLPGSGATLYIPISGPTGNITAIISGIDSNMAIVTASGLASANPFTVYLGAIVSNISASANSYISIYGDVTAKKEGGILVTGIGELAWKSAVDDVTNTVSANSAHWGQGGVDSATVSAIASAYQVVSSTASGSGEIFGQTSYYATEINGLTLSAQEAALATYATNAGSAAAAPTNSATVSAIASSYAESAVSSKADSSSLSSYALSSDVSGVIDTVSANSASWSGGTLPITGSAGNDSATYDVNGIVYEHASIDEFDPHRDALISVDSFGISHVTPGGDFYGVNLTDTGLSFIDQDGYHTIEASSIDSWNSAVDTVANNSAAWGQGGVDSATVSSIASSYAESAASSKMDTSAMTSYALSSDVSGTVDLVSTQSANWGGSALALSAGPGVKLEKVGNTLVAGLDETVLWSGTTTSITGITLNESYANFDRVRFYWNPWTDTMSWQVTDVPGIVSYFNLSCGWANNSQRAFFVYEYSSTDHLNFSQVNGAFTNITGTAWTTATACKVYKVVGINRTAGV